MAEEKSSAIFKVIDRTTTGILGCSVLLLAVTVSSLAGYITQQTIETMKTQPGVMDEAAGVLVFLAVNGLLYGGPRFLWPDNDESLS